MQFKTLAILSILSILFFAGCDSKDKNENQEGTKVEEVKQRTDFALTTTDGKTINLNYENNKLTIKEYPGKLVLVNFFATWCQPCKAEIPNLVNLQNYYKNDFVVISLLLEDGKSNEELNEFAKSFDINYEISNTRENFEFAKALGGVKSIPTMYMIDKESNIFQKYVGLVPFEMMEIDIKKLLAK